MTINLGSFLIKALTLLIISISTCVSASTISYVYQGTITSVVDPSGILSSTGMAPILSTFSGRFTYIVEPLTGLPSNDPADTRYDLTNFELQIDGNDVFTSPGGTIALNDDTGSWGDLVNIIGDQSTATYGYLSIDSILPQLMFSDFTRTNFDNGIVMPAPLSISDFDVSELVFQAHLAGSTTAWGYGAITSISEVPLPASLYLFVSALIGLFSVKKGSLINRG